MSMPSADRPSSGTVVVIGAGAAGMYAAAALTAAGVSVTVLEHAREPGRKLMITGKGRCNVTNACTPQEFLREVPRNPRFLFSAIAKTPPEAVMRFFEEHGVPLKTERGRRVFPVSDKSADIVNALRTAIRPCTLVYGSATDISVAEGTGRVTGVNVGDRFFPANAVILATGGLSYPGTGSDGSGYGLAEKRGHTVTNRIPSLVPLVSRDSAMCARLQGIAPKNVAFTVRSDTDGHVLYEDFGEMLFTHFGISGPMVLSASAHLRDADIGALTASIDWKPALDEATIDARLLSDFTKYANRDLENAMTDLLPVRVIPEVLRMAAVDPHKKPHSLTRDERHHILRVLKDFRIGLAARRPITEAVITSGGIDVREVSPKTMMSRKADGLFFAGEILDVDAYTGGYNLQIAFATAAAAAAGVIDYLSSPIE